MDEAAIVSQSGQVTVSERLDRWVLHVRSGRDTRRLLCLADRGMAVWAVAVSDLLPDQAWAEAVIVPAGAVRLSAGLVPIPRERILSGTCIQVTGSCRDMVAARTVEWLFDQPDHQPTVCVAPGGKQWVTVRANGPVCWIAPVHGTRDAAGRDHALRLPPSSDNSDNSDNSVRGWVGARGGIRPARLSMLTPETFHTPHLGSLLRDLFDGFFSPSR